LLKIWIHYEIIQFSIELVRGITRIEIKYPLSVWCNQIVWKSRENEGTYNFHSIETMVNLEIVGKKWLRGNRDLEGGSLRTRPCHCTSARLTPAIDTNVVDSGVQFLIVGDCVRAVPFPITNENKSLNDCCWYQLPLIFVK